MKQIRIFCMIVMMFFCTTIKANNIVISNITSVTGSGFVQLQFDLSWENSWFSSINNDAAWVFFKFKDRDGTWRHLSLTNANNSISSGYTITVPSDKSGAFISLSSIGSGTVTLTGTQLGVNNLPGNFDIKAFAIEMVRIPANDTYYVGDGTNSLSYYQIGNASGTAFLINSNSITMGTSAGQLYDGLGGNGNTLAPSFPIAYNSGSTFTLYMMKHEISQGAYRDFLNTLTYDQQATRTVAAPSSATGIQAMGGVISRRHGIQISTSGVSNTTPAVYGCNLNNNTTYNEATDGEWIGCNYLTYMDVAAFLDWAALRPMTELEFEKSCRGPLAPVKDEFASGTAAYASTPWAFSNSGATNEIVSAYSGSVFNTNVTWNGTSPFSNSPTRVGIHATAYATRISAGAGYYGGLDLSGNIEEFCVTTCNAAGRSFAGVSGDGILNAAGDANENYWPGINGNNTGGSANTTYGGTTGVTGIAGVITRGGSAGYTIFSSKVSNRGVGPYTISTRNGISGGRGVKSF